MGNIDETISAIPGEWRFDAEVSQAFDSHVRKSVPFYDEIQRMVVELSEYFVGDGSVVYDLGSSTGETLNQLATHHQGKENLQLIGVEVSDSMIEQARGKISAPSVRFRHSNILDVEFSPPPDFVTSLYTLQFLRLVERRRLLQRLAANMVEGGALVLVEKTRGDSADLEDMWTELYWDFKRRNGLSPEQVLEKAASLRGVLNPLTFKENIALLTQCGFTRVEPFFKWYNWSGFIAVKNRCLTQGMGYQPGTASQEHPRTPDSEFSKEQG